MKHYFTNDASLNTKKHAFSYNIDGKDITFHTRDAMFSKDEVDEGSHILIHALPPLQGKLLDLGCAWGAIGISLKVLNPEIALTMLDINESACEMCQINLVSNALSAQVVCMDIAKFDGSNFDIVVTNPPIRAGNAVLDTFYQTAYNLLNQHGHFYLVVRKQQGAASTQKKLYILFGNCDLIERKNGYWILKCTKNQA